MADGVLVTGGAGYIGSHVARKLLARGHRVRVLDSFLYGDSGLVDIADHPDLELMRGDVCDPADVQRAVRGVQKVIALAALVGDAACEIDPQRTIVINYEATRRLLDACRQADVERLLFASSCSVYGASGDTWLNEDSELAPVSLYAQTRVRSEDLLLSHSDSLEVVILRLATVCGASPRMRFDLMVNTMTAHATVQGRIRASGTDQWRPHVHVQDAAEAFVLASELPLPSGTTLNVGSDDQNFTVAGIAERVKSILPETRIETFNGNGDRRSYRVSFKRIREELGFVPTWSVDAAIREVHELLSRGEFPDFEDEVYHNVKWLRRNRNDELVRA